MADVVVVGAGSAGCALAWALSADADTRVLLVEAGGPAAHWSYRMPAALAYPLARAGALWRFEGEPEEGLGGRRAGHPRGRLVGGTSAINGMMWVRGNARDFDGWAAAGAAGWGFASVLPALRAIERLEGGADPWRGGDGPLRVRRAGARGPLDRAFLGACAEAGHPEAPDFNGARQDGWGRFDQTIHRGARETAATAFLRAARGRANLRVLPGRVALGLAVEGGRARGVRVAGPDGVETLRAEREVVLCAGAFGSPHLLMLSGIGPADDLRRLGIPVAADRSGVGANLHDHPDIVVRFAAREPVSLHALTRPHRKAWAGARWLLRRDGPGATNHFEAGAFLRSSVLASGPSEPQPNLQLSFLPLALAPGATQSDASIGEHGFQVHVDLVKPASRGRLWLDPADPARAPRMGFGYLRDGRDVDRLGRALGIVREILAQPAMRPFAGRELTPGAGEGGEAWLRAHADTAYHPVGTCRMGRASDPLAVVDPEGRVIGVEGLRVADASVMPGVVGGNTDAASMMIGARVGALMAGRAGAGILERAAGRAPGGRAPGRPAPAGAPA